MTIQEYLLMIAISDDRHLLVEGRGDKTVFRILLDEARRTGYSTPARCVIDSAEMLTRVGTGTSGHRELVEAVAHAVDDLNSKNKIVCFVDREFREFDDRHWEDGLKVHRLSDRLVWSRGHSVENYFLDFDTIRQVLRAIAMTDGFDDAIVTLQASFLSVLRVGCAAGLAARDTGYADLIADSFDQSILDVDPDGRTAVIDVIQWKQRLLHRRSCTEEMAQTVIDAYERWHLGLASARHDVIRWMTHGHCALPVIWATYARCVFKATSSSTEANRSQGARKEIRFSSCAAAWAQRAFAGSAVFPQVVLEMLGFRQSSLLDEIPATPPR